MVYYYWKFDNAGYERRLNMARKIGIDLGTTNLLICVDNKGILVDEHYIITVDDKTKKCIEAGAFAVVIGTSISEPAKIVKTILHDAKEG